VTVEDLLAELGRRGELVRGCGVEERPDGAIASRLRFVHALYAELLYEGIAPTRRCPATSPHRRLRGGELRGGRAADRGSARAALRPRPRSRARRRASASSCRECSPAFGGQGSGRPPDACAAAGVAHCRAERVPLAMRCASGAPCCATRWATSPVRPTSSARSPRWRAPVVASTSRCVPSCTRRASSICSTPRRAGACSSARARRAARCPIPRLRSTCAAWGPTIGCARAASNPAIGPPAAMPCARSPRRASVRSWSRTTVAARCSRTLPASTWRRVASPNKDLCWHSIPATCSST